MQHARAPCGGHAPCCCCILCRAAAELVLVRHKLPRLARPLAVLARLELELAARGGERVVGDAASVVADRLFEEAAGEREGVAWRSIDHGWQ